jgi:predicted alpha/beta superfamily hydrolase
LLGHSSAAYFALYVLFQQPQVFQRYVVASVYLGEGQDLITISPKQHDTLPVRLHLVNEVANEEDIAHFRAYIELLESQHYSGFRLTHQVMTNYTHCAVVPPAFQAGLVAVFS